MSEDNLTIDQQACNFETMKHIQTVQKYLHWMVRELLNRAELHDQSKLVPPEVEALTKNTPNLAGLTYGSKEYEKNINEKEMADALAHHYAKNRHHPQHFPDGVNGMTLIDILEMFCDWKAATLRHHDGNLLKSIEKNADRFQMSPQLKKIFENTAETVD